MKQASIHTEPTKYHYDNNMWLYNFMNAFFYGFVQNNDYAYDLKPTKKGNILPITSYSYDTFIVLNTDYNYFCGDMNKLTLQNGYFSVSAASSSVFWKHTATEFETGFDYFGARFPIAIGSSDLSIWLSVDPLSDKYPSMSPYMYVAGNPIYFIDSNGEDIFIYYIGPETSITGLRGHTAIGANNGGNSPISYYPAYGSIAAWKKIEHTTPDGGVYYTYKIDEQETMEAYAKDGEYVSRMRLILPEEVEKIIKEGIDDYIETGGTSSLGDGIWCTLQVKDIIYSAYIEAGYSEEDATAARDKIIPYSTPENPTASEKSNSGYIDYTEFKVNKQGKVEQEIIKVTPVEENM